MTLEVNSAAGASIPDSKVIAPQRTELVNEQVLSEDYIKALKSSLHKGGEIDNFKGAHFETKKAPLIKFFIKAHNNKQGTFVIKVSGDESSTAEKSKRCRGHQLTNIKVTNDTINQTEHSDLLAILRKKSGQTDDTRDRLHGKKKKKS